MVVKKIETVLDELQCKVDEVCNEVGRLREENRKLKEEEDLSEYIHKDFRDAREFLERVKKEIEQSQDKPYLDRNISYRGYAADIGEDIYDVYGNAVSRIMDKWL